MKRPNEAIFTMKFLHGLVVQSTRRVLLPHCFQFSNKLFINKDISAFNIALPWNFSRLGECFCHIVFSLQVKVIHQKRHFSMQHVFANGILLGLVVVVQLSRRELRYIAFSLHVKDLIDEKTFQYATFLHNRILHRLLVIQFETKCS